MATNKKLSATIIIGGAIAGSFKTAFGGTKSALSEIGKTVRDLTKRQLELGEAIKKTGSTGRYLEGLRNEYASLTTQLDRAKRAQDRLNVAAERSKKFSAIGHGLTGAGVKVGAAAAVIGASLVPGVKEAKHYQSEEARISALGMGPEANREASHFAAKMKSFGVSQTENLTLVRDAMSIFGDVHHAQMVAPTLAKMKFGNAAVYGEHGAENETKFMDMLKVIELRGGTKNKAAFDEQANMIQKVISATGGRVGADEWRHAISTGGLAAKSMRNDAFYYQLEPLVQEMGGDRVGTSLMSGYSSLYQGRTTKRALENLQKLGLIGDKSKVKSDKAGQIAHIDVGALKGAQLFRQSQYEWMKQVLLPTLASKGLTTKDQVLDAIGSIFSARKGADLMAAMYLQQQQIDKSEKVNRGAADIDTLDKTGRGMASGKELEAEARLADLKLRMGKAILPLYSSALETAATALEKLNAFTDAHPRLAKGMMIGLAVVGGTLAVVAPVLITVGAGMLALSGATTAMAVAGPILSTVLGGIGTAILFIGRALLMNPIGLTLTAIAGAAYLIYKNWDTLGPFFAKLWQGISDATSTACAAVSQFFGGVWADVKSVGGAALEWITSKIKGVGDTWVKAKELFGFGGGDAGKPGAPSAAGQTPPSVPAARAGGANGATYQDNSTNNWHITQQPGQDSKAFAAELAKQSAAQRRQQTNSILYDAPRGY